MSKLVWDASGQRLYEAGVDHGVLFVRTDAGYAEGVVWNGLITVNESPSGAEASPQYADNMKYLSLVAAENFSATIEAYTYPDEFAECDGTAEPVPGLLLGQQRRKGFGFSYRTKVGNDTVGQDYGYKIHVVYGAQAKPSEKSYGTINESPEAITFSWEVTSNPETAPEPYENLSTITLDSTKLAPATMAQIETILYGDAETEARLPLPTELLTLAGYTAPVGG